MTDSPRTRRGAFIVIVGASGSGKDTLIDFARTRLAEAPDVLFVRRIVTRRPDAQSEDHIGMDETAFDAARDQGQFAFAWQAHGLNYAFPAAVDHHLERGGVAVANGSRATLSELDARYQALQVVHVTVSPPVRAERLRRRGRESEAEITARLARATGFEIKARSCLTLSNDGPIEEAGEALVSCIQRFRIAGANV
ncbi:phosphonate metabolism protein/1,5-bisphosphokinase (PRPP-forming) PhnN [Pararhizobium haloflavum]|uniref:phosphonate metabolism protein/1,5-bisphosphokinase (PRPP-forming) PhnN n=1 Tax=Pararhizobium haloflavum TaxID=2037914 RepID=UPI000C1808A5|nr:phosphonate metabolism protein/1,5-bisphosphokinase (PRPP-forming) PhnN [Pararhizobium haloflavum]